MPLTEPRRPKLWLLVTSGHMAGQGMCHAVIEPISTYSQTSIISHINPKMYMFFYVSSCNCLCPIHWSQVLSREWRCSWASPTNWSSADRRCSNYIWVINKFIAYQAASHIRGLTIISLNSRIWNLKFIITCICSSMKLLILYDSK